MRLKECYVHDCPLCGTEIEMERDICPDCSRKLLALQEYESWKFLLGAVVSEIKVEDLNIDSLVITTNKGSKYRVYILDCPVLLSGR